MTKILKKNWANVKRKVHNLSNDIFIAFNIFGLADRTSLKVTVPTHVLSSFPENFTKIGKEMTEIKEKPD